MGIQFEKIQFDKGIPSNDLILRRIFESTGLKVRLSIDTLLTEKQAEELAKKAGFKDFISHEIVVYSLDHPKYQGIKFRLVKENEKEYIEFETGAGFLQKTLMDIFRDALISLGGDS